MFLFGCSSSSNPESVVKKYLQGFIESNKKAIWEASSDDYLNGLLNQTEKNSSFNEFSKVYNKSNYPFFNEHIKYNITKTEFKHETHANVYVEIIYSSNYPYQINKYKSGKKISLKIYTKKISNTWSVDKVQLEKIIDYNKAHDMLKAEELIENEAQTNISKALSSFKQLENYSDYFENIESINQNLENAKLLVFKKEKRLISSANYDQLEITNPSCSNKNYGSYIKGRVINNYSTAIIDVQLKAKFRTYEYSESGWDCNSLKWESKSFTKYFTVKNIPPGESKTFEEFFEIRVTGKTQRGFCFGSGKTKTVSIKNESLSIYPNLIEIQGVIEN